MMYTHAARQLPDGKWTSKLGQLEDITHTTYGVTQGLGVENIFLRREQFRLAEVPAFCLRLGRALVAGKIRNQRTMLQPAMRQLHGAA